MKRESALRTFFGFIKKEKKYWLIPLIVFCVLILLLLLLVETAPVLSPFVYTLF